MMKPIASSASANDALELCVRDSAMGSVMGRERQTEFTHMTSSTRVYPHTRRYSRPIRHDLKVRSSLVDLSGLEMRSAERGTQLVVGAAGLGCG